MRVWVNNGQVRQIVSCIISSLLMYYFLHLLQWKIADCHWTLSLGGRAIVIGDTKYTGARSYSQIPTVIGWTQY
jgi:hypothetical protein